MPAHGPHPPEKHCQACGRRMRWRSRWARNWSTLRYCSAACRNARPNATDRRLEQMILELLAARAPRATICPSEAARLVFEPQSWRAELERTRRAARRLAQAGQVTFTRHGAEVDPSTARGPVRLRRGPRFAGPT